MSNDIEYTEHENFEVKRAGTVEFEKVPADGSKKMDDTLMESVEPYDFKEAVPFRMAYMQAIWQTATMCRKRSASGVRKNVSGEAQSVNSEIPLKVIM